jgi:hypothetical protein
VADIQSQFEIRAGRRVRDFFYDFSLVLHAVNLVKVSPSYWNQDKVR